MLEALSSHMCASCFISPDLLRASLAPPCSSSMLQWIRESADSVRPASLICDERGRAGTPRGPPRSLVARLCCCSIPLARCRRTCQVSAGYPVHSLVHATTGKSRMCKRRADLFFNAQRGYENVTLGPEYSW